MLLTNGKAYAYKKSDRSYMYKYIIGLGNECSFCYIGNVSTR